jgi:uncharacterized protein involved in outer membrane biogenesis
LRTGLTALAVLVILALTTALVGPYFVDWGKQRAAVETQLSRVLGEQVKVRGSIDLKLLPTPYLTLGEVEIADRKSNVFFSCERVVLELGLTSLTRGQFRFTRASFDHPTIELGRGPDGQVLLPRLSLAARSDSIALETVAVHDGRVRITGGSRDMSVAGIDVDAEADSLLGPFRGSGEASGPGGAKVRFHFATGAVEGDQLRLKATIEPGSGVARAEFDGVLAFAAATPTAGASAVGYTGAATFAGQISNAAGAPTPWLASGILKADLQAASLDNLDARVGPEDRALAASGSAQMAFGATPRLSVALAAKQLNLDALLRAEGEDSAAPAQVFESLSGVLAEVGIGSGPPIAVSFDFQTPAAILGGDTIADVSLSATAGPGEPIAGRLEASPPGRSHILASGAIDLGAALGFKGRVEARTADAQRLREWLTLRAPDLDARLAAVSDVLPYRSGSASGEMDFSAAGFVGRDLNLVLDRSAFVGTLALTRAVGAERGRIFMDLRTDSLDLDALPNLNVNSALWGALDLSLTLNARSLRIARLGEGQVEGGSLAVRLTKQNRDVRLDRLSIADLGGASVEASGAIDAKGRRLSANIDAAKLRDFALLVRHVAPGPLGDLLVDRSESLSPVKLALNAQFSNATGDAPTVADSLDVEGAAGETHINARLDRQSGDAEAVVASLSLDAPEAAPLLRQIGLPAMTLAGSGRGHVVASLRGRWGEDIDGDLTASLAGADLLWRGRVSPSAWEAGDGAFLQGAGRLKTVNAMPLLAVLRVASPGLTLPIPVDISAQLAWRGDQLVLSQLKGAVGAAHFTGDLTYRPTATPPIPLIPIDPDLALAQAIAGDASTAPGSPPQLEGAVSVDRLAFSALAGLALGAPQAATPKTLWSDVKFSPGLDNAPSADIALKVASLDVADGVVAHDASARLTLGRGFVGLDGLSMNVAGGALVGRLTVRRNGPDASLAGRLSIEPIVVDRPSFAGRLSGGLEFAATGQSAGALVAGLAGTGHIRTSGARIPRLDQGAVGRIVAKAQSPDYPIDETNIDHALDLEFGKQALRIPDVDALASLTGGVLRVGPFETRDIGDQAKLEASFDIRSFVLEIRAAFTELQTTKFWSGAPPTVAVVLKGSVEAPTRQIDSSLFVAGLSAQAIARETERIAALESDIRERAFFNRRLKADQFLRRRELELEAYALDKARQKWDEDRRRVEAETLKADEERRKAATSDPTVIPPASPAPTPRDPLQSATGSFLPPPQPPTPSPRPPPHVDPTTNGLY